MRAGGIGLRWRFPRGPARAISRCLPLLLVAMLVAGCAATPRAADAPAMFGAVDAAPSVRVMAFNVRVPVDTDDDRWENRRDLLVATIADADADIVGTQELVPLQRDFIRESLPRYAFFGRGRSGVAGTANDESVGVFWKRDTLRLLDHGDFWLSGTPDVPGSITWGNLFPRMVSWGLFERRADGLRFYLLNTHFPYRDSDAPPREKSARAILAWIDAHAGDVPVVLTGDFNDVPGSATHRLLSAALPDAWEQAPERSGPDGTFHDFTGVPGKRLDWVLARGLRPLHARSITTHDGPRWPSDHLPVLVDYAGE